jgi:hypothetical protein
MRTTIRRTSIGAGVLAATFALGYVVGSVSTPPAEAGLSDIVKDAAKSGSLGSIGELGSSIIDMQEHVDGLQKNLETLRKVKAALGG